MISNKKVKSNSIVAGAFLQMRLKEIFFLIERVLINSLKMKLVNSWKYSSDKGFPMKMLKWDLLGLKK